MGSVRKFVVATSNAKLGFSREDRRADDEYDAAPAEVWFADGWEASEGRPIGVKLLLNSPTFGTVAAAAAAVGVKPGTEKNEGIAAPALSRGDRLGVVPVGSPDWSKKFQTSLKSMSSGPAPTACLGVDAKRVCAYCSKDAGDGSARGSNRGSGDICG